ncbi:hypothetical protein ZWY2020_035589, partial [Hordeum vulgare]
MEAGTDGAVKCAIRRVVDLQNLLPSRPRFLVSCANGVDVFFVGTDLGTFTVEINSGRVKKVSSGTEVIPYMRFYTPDLAGGVTSENVEMTQGEHHDLLLPNTSEDVGDEKEKLIEKDEEDGWEEEAEEEELEWEGKKTNELFDKGCKAIEEEQFVHAECCFHDVLESSHVNHLIFRTLPPVLSRMKNGSEAESCATDKNNAGSPHSIAYPAQFGCTWCGIARLDHHKLSLEELAFEVDPRGARVGWPRTTTILSFRSQLERIRIEHLIEAGDPAWPRKMGPYAVRHLSISPIPVRTTVPGRLRQSKSLQSRHAGSVKLHAEETKASPISVSLTSQQWTLRKW